jgi:hypothetical protein
MISRLSPSSSMSMAVLAMTFWLSFEDTGYTNVLDCSIPVPDIDLIDLAREGTVDTLVGVATILARTGRPGLGDMPPRSVVHKQSIGGVPCNLVVWHGRSYQISIPNIIENGINLVIWNGISRRRRHRHTLRSIHHCPFAQVYSTS